MSNDIVRRDTITKGNALIEACYKLSLTEMQVILYAIKLINPLSEKFPEECRINVIDFANMFNRNHSTIYEDIRCAIVNKFWVREIRYFDDNLQEYVKERWVNQVRYGTRKGYVTIKFTEEIKPHLHKLSKNFTVYYIDQITKLKSFYSIRFYEIFIMNINKSQEDNVCFVLSLYEIKDRLEINDKYDKYANLKLRILSKAKSEINKYSDLIVDYEEIKKARTVEKIKFTIQRKKETNQAKNELNLPIEVEKKLITSDKLPSEQELATMMQRNELRALMISEYKITEHKADELLKEYSLERIEGAIRKIQFLVRRDSQKVDGVKNRAGYLVECIKNNWTKE